MHIICISHGLGFVGKKAGLRREAQGFIDQSVQYDTVMLAPDITFVKTHKTVQQSEP